MIQKYRAMFFILLAVFSDGMAETIVKQEPVDDVLFAEIAELYHYDPSLPLDTEIVGVWSARLPYIIEKVSYQSTHNQRVPAYFAHPSDSTEARFPAVLLIHGSNSFWGKNEAWSLEWMDILARAGFCVLVADLPGYGERIGPNKEDELGPYTERDLDIQAVTDQRRGLDYLFTRSEVDTTRVGLLGGSLGGWYGMLVAGLDDRLTAVVLTVTGTWLGEDTHTSFWRYAHTLNFAPRIQAPVLMVNATGDGRDQGEALFAVVQTEKEQIWYESEHYLPPREYSSDIMAWLHTHLK